jgi:hypothetical protein
MDWVIQLLYYIYSFFAKAAWFCRRNVEQYFLVAPDGKQYPLSDYNLTLYDHLLVVYYTPVGTRYRFQPLHKSIGYCTATNIKSAYKSFQEPKKYKLYAVNATIHERVHTINAIEFNVLGNEIFTPVFNLWLCYNYLHIAPSLYVEVSYIDDSTSICITKGPIRFQQDALRIDTELPRQSEEQKQKQDTEIEPQEVD